MKAEVVGEQALEQLLREWGVPLRPYLSLEDKAS
jgi:ABC-type uncharacterized transport system involved in gliding motility auxiliary subunit